MASLDDLVKEVKAQRSATEDLAMTFGEWFEQMQRDRLDQLEEKREQKKTKPAASTSGAFQAGEKFTKGGFGLGMLLNPAKMLAPLIAGVTAFAAGIAGLRGWELKAITKATEAIDDLRVNTIAKLGNISTKALDNFKLFGQDILVKYFGFQVEGTQGRDAQGRFTPKAGSIKDQLMARITKFQTGIMSFFGFADDATGGVKAPTGPTLSERATKAFNTILGPIKSVTKGITDFAAGAGKGIIDFFEPYVKGAAKFGSLFGKILWPIGFLFSAFDGVTAYRDGEGKSLIDRLGDGIGGFVGDFIGAPFDLLKSGINWVFDNVFGVQRDENGNVMGEGWAAWASKKMSEFSFEETIKTLVDAPFNMIQKAVDWVKGLFTDPTTTLQNLWDTTVVALGNTPFATIGRLVGDAAEWIKSKFTWSTSEDDDNSFDLTQYVKDTWQTVVDRVKQGFEDFGNWVASIPAKLKLMAVKTIDAATPDWLIDMSDDIAAAEQAVRAFNTPTRETTGTSVAAASGRLDAGGGQVVVIQDNSQNSGGDTLVAPTSIQLPMSTEAPGTADVNNPFYGYHMMGQGYVNQ